MPCGDQQTQCSGRPEQAVPATRGRGTLPEQRHACSGLSLMLLSFLLLALGCGQEGGLPLASVEGSVAYQGKLLDHGMVVFTPQEGAPGPPATGKIQLDGSFVMRTAGREGAVVGSHKVTVHCRRELTSKEIRNRSRVTPESLIPDKYWKQKESSLVFEVKEGKSSAYDIVLE